MTGQTNRLAALTLVIATVSLVFAVASFLQDPEPTDAPLQGTDVALERRIAELERSLDELLRAPEPQTAAPVPASAPRTSVDDAADTSGLEQRIADLERRLSQQQAQAPRENLSPIEALIASGALRDRSEENSKSTEEWTQVAIDRSKTEEERVRALSALRGRGKGARAEPVLSAMVEIAQTSADGEIRADVWRQMSGADEDGLVQPLIHAVLNDSYDEAREEAAETLGDYIGTHPHVRSILQQVADSDASEDVVDQARRSLGQRRR